jgi:UDP-glucuronate decarboxylase
MSNKQIHDFVKPYGNKYNKYVPQWIKDSDPEIIAEFVRCAVDGDGWRDRNHEAYATVSKRLSDDMQELYLKLGYGVSETVRVARPHFLKGVVGHNTVDQYHVHRSDTSYGQLRDSKNKPNFGSVWYEGKVYCASVPNGTLIVRRHGKVAVCGNCVVGAAVGASTMGCVLGGENGALHGGKARGGYRVVDRAELSRIGGRR